MGILNNLTLVVEAVSMVLGILLAVKKKKVYGWFIALTFAAYVFYDIAELIPLHFKVDVWAPIYTIAAITMLYALWKIYKEVGKG